MKTVSLLLLMLIGASLQQTSSARDCTLDCPSDAPCTNGVADFSSHMIDLQEHQNGMHCACPYGWTGVLCDHKYETCDGGHPCYHGGECVPGLTDKFGNDQLFCDCTSAVASDGTKYVGKYCETPFEKICNDDGDQFCVNGGDCNPNFPSLEANPCICPDEWEGQHCEFKKGTVPQCTLDCKNEGQCVVGIKDPAEADKIHHIWSQQEIGDHMHCICTEDFGGPLCESSAETCGEDQCYHGGTCVETSVTNSQGVTRQEFHCDCTTADDGTNLFAGKYCQYPSNQFCSELDDNLFCTNGGTCKDDPTQGCNCPPGYKGFKCEFRDEQYFENDQASSLTAVDKCGDVYCFNHGKCITTEITLSDGTTETQQSCDCSMTFDGNHYWAGSSCQYKSTSLCGGEADGDIMFCVHSGECPTDGSDQCSCPDGWEGDHCETHIYALEDEYPDAPTCGDRVCLNGGQCVSTQVIKSDDTVETLFHCDCSTAFDNNFHYAGESCQFPSTELCTHDGESMEGRLFCTNHGQCQDDPMQGCNCPHGFEGFSCEFEVLDKNPADDRAEDVEQCGDSLVCHNGGVCVTSLIYTQDGGQEEIKHCDCTKAAIDSTAFAGDMCQFEATAFCTAPAGGLGMEGTFFCVNHGQCNSQDVRQGCECPNGWTGFRCEFLEELEDMLDDQADSTTVACGDLTCFNNGSCEAIEITNETTGEASTAYKCNCAHDSDGSNFFAGPQCEYRSTDTCSEEDPSGAFCVNGGTCKGGPLEGCDCPAGWTGTMCDIVVKDDQHADQGEACGNGYCYNGGVCVQTLINTAGGTITEFHCSCEQAFDDEHRYGGLSCEHKSTSFCARSNQGESLAGVSFCANGGTCNDENPNRGCDCPTGWTGMSCEFQSFVPEDDDDSEDTVQCGEFACLNGGTCVVTTVKDNNGSPREIQHCDCSTAITENDVFAGTQCEFKQTSFCSEPAEGEDLSFANFCTNGGTCRENVLSGCECPDAFLGFRCEYQKEADDLIDEMEDPKLVDNFVPCGSEFCYNGGTCESHVMSNGQTAHRCNCDTAATASTLFAGKFCQYEMTSLCASGNLDSMSAPDFCVNNGRCPDGDEDVGCTCPSGYTGFRCEEPRYADQDNEDNIAPDLGADDDDGFYRCRLQCQNGGTCAKGAKDMSQYHGSFDHVSHLNQTYDEDYFEHCICKQGWFGLECEHQAVVCGADEHLCLHGSKCVKNDDEHGCDCSEADEIIDGTDHSLFAGDSCQHPATDICTYGNNSPGRPLYFCTNQGQCNDYVTPSDPDPGCKCTNEWTGPHCEIPIEDAYTPDNRGSSSSNSLLFIIGGLCLTIGILAFAYLLMKKSSNSDPSTSCMPLRRRRRNIDYDPTNSVNNLAPKRISAFSSPEEANPPPSRTFSFRSGSDPMTEFELPPDNEPVFGDSVPRVPYRDEPFQDEPDDEPGRSSAPEETVILLDAGPATDEDGNQLHSVDFL